MKTFRCPLSRRALLCVFALAAVAAAKPARAVTLEQKWLAGQQLNYDMTLSGTLTLDTEAGAPVLWAGLPLEVQLKGNGEVALDTRRVEDDGSGIVAFKVPSLKVTGTAWEQNAVLEILGGQPSVSFNGKKMDAPKDKKPNLQFLVEPTYGLQISKTGHIERAVPLAPPDTAAKPAPDTDAAPTAGLPVNIEGLIRSAFFQMLPAPWPADEVKVGETWSVTSRLPIPAVKSDDAKTDDAAKPAFEVLDLGKFDMTLKGEEDLDGKPTMRVAVVGMLALDAAKAARLNEAFKAQGNKLSSLTQKISGDLWFDAAAGQLVKAALVLKGQLKNVNTTPAKDGAKAKSWNATQSFYGNLGFKLKSVSMIADAGVAQ